MANYPDWNKEASPGDRVAFDLGYSYALLHRAAAILEACMVGSELLRDLHEFDAKRLAIRDKIYQGAYELGARLE